MQKHPLGILIGLIVALLSVWQVSTDQISVLSSLREPGKRDSISIPGLFEMHSSYLPFVLAKHHGIQNVLQKIGDDDKVNQYLLGVL